MTKKTEDKEAGKRLPRFDDLVSKELSRRITELEQRVIQLEQAAGTPRTREELAATVNQWKGWPEDQPLRYNGSGTPCDMWTGPCCCKAFHRNGK